MVPLSGVVLAGGQSRRMGTDKAFLHLDARPLIDHIVEKVAAITAEVIVVTNTPEEYEGLGDRVVADVIPGKGSLGGLYSGLLTAGQPYSIVVACDMPFLNQNLLRFMALMATEHDAVIPRVGSPRLDRHESENTTQETAKEENLHPLHAVYSKACVEPIKDALERGDLRLISFLSEVRVRYVKEHEMTVFDPNCLSVFNANTPEDWERVQELLEKQQ